MIGPDNRVWGVASFIYSEDGTTEPSCGTAPGAYNAIYPWLDFIDSVVESTGTCVARGPEICNGVDDDCNGQVDEICTPLGQACAADAECVGGTCRDTSIGRVCTAVCDPLRPAEGCAPGFYCAGGGSCNGFCLPGGVGALPNESLCTVDTNCESLFCDDPGDGIRRCLDPCRGDAGLCLAGEVCAVPAGVCGSCVPRERVAAPRGLGEPCGSDAECRGEMVCRTYGDISECARACASSDEECGDGFECRDNLCIRDRRQGVGGPCIDSADCGGGTCAHQGGRSWCTVSCTADSACPTGFSCQAAGSSRVCAPAAALVGEGCSANEECASGLCATVDGSGVCTTFCDGATTCGAGFDCVRLDDGSRSAVCRRASSGCSVVAGSPAPLAPWLGAGALALLAVMRRRRRG